MTVTAKGAVSGIPVADDQYVVVNAGTTALVVHPGDYMAFSGSAAIAVNTGVAYWKASGIGVALDSNPAYDWAGRAVVNSALLVATHGVFQVSAQVSGLVSAGLLAYPATTGSGSLVSGATGVGAAWATAAPVFASGATGVSAGSGAVAQIIASQPAVGGTAGDGQMTIRLWPRNADFY